MRTIYLKATSKKPVFIILGLLLLTLMSSAQSWQWAKRPGSANDNTGPGTNEMITDLKIDRLGNIYASGYFFANPSFNNGEAFGATTPVGFGYSDAYLIKYSACGKTLWVRRMGGNGYDGASSLVLDNSGRVIVTGYCSGTGTNSFGDGTHDTLANASSGVQFIAKFDTAGNFKEVKNYPWGLGKRFINSQGNYIVTDGLTAVKINNTNGAPTFTYNFVTTTPFYPSVQGIAMDKSDNIYISGSFNNTVNIGPGTILLPTPSTLIANTFAPNALIMKFSPSGTMLWYKRGISQREDEFAGLGIDTSGTALAVAGYEQNNFGICNYTLTTNNNLGASFLLKLNTANGNLIWGSNANQDYGSGLYNPVVFDRDNNINLGGVLNGTISYSGSSNTYSSNSYYQNCIGKYDNSGTFLSLSALPQIGDGNGLEKVSGMDISEQGNIYIGGMFGGTLDSAGTAVNIIGGSEDGYVAKFGFACNSSSTSLSPLPPASLTAVYQPSLTNKVTWVDNSQFETGFQLWAIGGSITTYSMIATLAANTTTYMHTNLQASKNYCYKVRAIDATGPSAYTNIGCASTPSAPSTGSTIGIATVSILADFNIFPNPTSGHVTLQFVSTGSHATVEVMNVLGELVEKKQIQTSGGENNYQLSMPVSKGIYMVRIYTETSRMIKKVIVE